MSSVLIMIMVILPVKKKKKTMQDFFKKMKQHLNQGAGKLVATQLISPCCTTAHQIPELFAKYFFGASQ